VSGAGEVRSVRSERASEAGEVRIFRSEAEQYRERSDSRLANIRSPRAHMANVQRSQNVPPSNARTGDQASGAVEHLRNRGSLGTASRVTSGTAANEMLANLGAASPQLLQRGAASQRSVHPEKENHLMQLEALATGGMDQAGEASSVALCQLKPCNTSRAVKDHSSGTFRLSSPIGLIFHYKYATGR
jgi:hypothetical protein